MSPSRWQNNTFVLEEALTVALAERGAASLMALQWY